MSTRKGPSQSATLSKEGTVKKGNDGNKWIIVTNKLGVRRWQKMGSNSNKTTQKIKSKSKSKSKRVLKMEADPNDGDADGADAWMKSADIKAPTEGMISKDGRVYIKNKWVAVSSDKAILNGFRKFTVDYAAKHISKPVILYTREYGSKWPARNAWTKSAGNADNTYSRMKFIPNGDAGIFPTKKKFVNWLTTRSPSIKEGTHFYVDGETFICNNKAQRISPYDCDPDEFLADGLQVDTKDKQTLSTNLMNTEVFVKA